MVNPNRLIKITKAESKDLLDKAQNIIDKDILGPNFKRDKLLKKDKKKDKVKNTQVSYFLKLWHCNSISDLKEKHKAWGETM